MKKYILLFISVFCLIIYASNNNVRLDGVAKITEVNSGVATIELSLKWDNAWMDDNLERSKTRVSKLHKAYNLN